MSQDIINNRFLEESVFAIADGYCVINLSKNIVRGSMHQVVDGKVYNLNEQLGMPENSNLQILVDAWALTIPEEGREDFLKEFNRERLLNRFENGERHISFRYWTLTTTFEPMLAEELPQGQGRWSFQLNDHRSCHRGCLIFLFCNHRYFLNHRDTN